MPTPLSFVRALQFSVLFCVPLCAIGCKPSEQVSSQQLEQMMKDQPPSDDELRQRLDAVIEFNRTNRRLNLRDHAAWQIVHGSLAYERDFLIEDRDGKLVSAIDYLLDGGTMTGWVMQQGVPLGGEPARFGLRAVLEQGSKTGQGHADQWLGYLADCDLKRDQVIKFGGRDYTIEDMVRQAEYDVPFNATREYSWTLMGLTAYRPTSYEWTAGDGEKWSIAKLLEIEVEHDLAVSACGGSHRMSGISMALNQHLKQGGELTGPWLAAKQKIDRCIATAREYQNPDGTFSTNWFNRPGNSPDLTQSLAATGHVFEFIVMSSTDEELREPWLRRAAFALCRLFENTTSVELECGALYHAVRGLALYRQRVLTP